MKAKSRYGKPSRGSEPVEAHDRAEPVASSAEAATMIRTQIYLSPAEHDFLRTEAQRRNEPMAAVIRSLIDEKMHLPDEVWENNSLLAPPADPAFMGPEDGAINHDHYIHGTPKKWMKRGGKWVETPPLPEDYYTNRESATAYDRLVEESR